MFHWLRSTWGGGADLLASARPAAVKNWPLNIFIFFSKLFPFYGGVIFIVL